MLGPTKNLLINNQRQDPKKLLPILNVSSAAAPKRPLFLEES